uniref:Uncharacterized protein n=1 Tax=Pseudomonas phage RVTF4 TaxID=3236931 RepID=A0AB39CCG0_9VIRU
MSRKYIRALSQLTAYMRGELLDERRYHLMDVARAIHEEPSVVEEFLAAALRSDYRDEQLEIFCSMITSTIWPKEMNSATVKMNFTVGFPPPKIMAALAQMPDEEVDKLLDTKEGRVQLEEYIKRYWIPARDGWLLKLDSDMERSGLAKHMDGKYPKIPPIQAAVMKAIDELSLPINRNKAAELASKALGVKVTPDDIVSY